MADSGDHPSGFWTLTRPSKLSKRRNSDLHELHHKVFNVCVVGLSGVEKDKGPIGIGKSCLCNRFVRSAADDYNTDHISVLSQSDFNGRVVNNDHWLYWGSVIKSCDGYDLAFNVVEQTEFVDDSCFQPFKSGKTEPYFKRCTNTKLVSPEKLMYICKNQLGIEREYEQRYLPDGKFNVDGFLCLFDVSAVQGRDLDKQIEMTNLILLNLIKTKKPIVFVTTKHDEASELLMAEAERLVNQRDFRGLIPWVETSAQENVNINIAFLVCAQMIDKTRTKLRIPPYFEAYKNHIDLLNTASDAYIGLIRSTVIDYRSSWQQVCMKLSHNPEFLQYTYLHGLDKATLVFKNHLKILRDESIGQKVQIYLKVLPDILNEVVPRNITSNIINDNSNTTELASSTSDIWEYTKKQIRSHPLFNKYFLQFPPEISWYDTDLLQSTDSRIPFDWLDSEEAYAIFRQRNLIYETEKKRQTTKEMFARMLSEIKIPVGKPFIEVKHMFSGDSSLEILNDEELFEVYVEYQNNLLQQARSDFQELLLENAEHLHHLTSSNKVIRQEDIKTINAILQHDERYQALDRFDQDRTLMMIRHLSFLHSQISEQCPSYPKCVEPEVERLLITKAKSLVSKYFESKQDSKLGPSSASYQQKSCDIVIVGPRRPSQQLMLALNVLNSRAAKVSQYQINFTVFDNAEEVDAQIQKFRQIDNRPKGCFGIFTNRRSLDHVSYTLEKYLILNARAKTDKNSFGCPPVVMLYAADITLDERTMLALENEGQQVADRFKCPFMNVTAIDQYRQHQQIQPHHDQDSTSQVMSECASLDYECVDAAFNVLKEAVSRRVCFMELYNNQDLIPRQAFNPDARLMMCLLCGEPFSAEHFMWRMFLDYEDCYVTSSKSICLKVRLDGGVERFIEVTITSYTHGAFSYREELLHGFILACSIQRKASISVLNAFSFNIPCTPVLVMAIKSDPSEGMKQRSKNNDLYDEDKESESLINEAQATAKRLKGHFELLDIREDQSEIVDDAYSINRIKNFLQNVMKRKPTIEQAYESGDVEVPNVTTMPGGKAEPSFPNSSQKDTTTDNPSISERIPAQVKTSSTRSFQSKTGLSSDDDLIDSSGPLDKSDESEPCSTSSNQAPTKPVRFSKLEDPYQSLNEIYSKRPLPPIPSSVAASAMPNSDIGCSGPALSETRYCHGDRLSSASGTASMTTGARLNDVPKPAPRKIYAAQQSSANRLQGSDATQSVRQSDCFISLQKAMLNKHKPICEKESYKYLINIQKRADAPHFTKHPRIGTNNHRTQVDGQVGRAEASEETNEDSDTAESDTEESSDNKLDKPKPGKLDLSQFDNITNAIGKLSIQPSQNKLPPSETKSSKVFTATHVSNAINESQPPAMQPDMQSGFFKSRNKKSTNKTAVERAKESPRKAPNDANSGDQLASFSFASSIARDNHRQQQARESTNSGTEFISHVGVAQPSATTTPSSLDHRQGGNKYRGLNKGPAINKDSAIRRKLSDDRSELQQLSSVESRSFKSENSQDMNGPKKTSLTSSFLASRAKTDLELSSSHPETNPEPKDLPRPAPRSTAMRTPVVSAQQTSTFGQSSSGVSSLSGSKRIVNNSRHNHGRAVAPPQLPSSALSGSTSRLMASANDGNNVDTPPGPTFTDTTKQQITSEEGVIDFSQSPIAQRLLMHSRDHKVSELNSPYESDDEPSLPTKLAKGHKLLRGRSLGIEPNTRNPMFTNSSIDSSELINSRGAAIRQLNEILANKQPPGAPRPPKHSANRAASTEQQEQQEPQPSTPQNASKKNDKDKDSKKVDKKKLRDDEKLEKRRLKEEERLRRQEKKLAAKKSKSGSTPDASTVGDDGVPLFIKRCIEFIEFEGLDAEGIYRVPGNRAHVDAFIQKFKENPDMSILESDIPVNAVATALKDFLSKKWGPIIPLALMNELTELSEIHDKEQRIEAVRQLVKKLPPNNYKLLKYVFSHFVKVSMNHRLNSMDSKNLAICWWPTLLPLHFNDMVMFEQMRPHLEDSIQTMIDQYDIIFDHDGSTQLGT